MMKLMKLKVMSIMLSLLVMSLPIAFAQLTNPVVFGDSNVTGYRRAVSDSTRVEVTVQGTNIDPGELTLNNVPFNQPNAESNGCRDLGDGNSLCWMYTKPYSAAPGSIWLTIKYSGDTETKELVSDDSPPSIAFNLAQTGGNITVEYNVSDRAYGSITTRCAGIKKVDVLDGSTVIDTLSGSQPGPPCSNAVSGTEILNIASSGNHNICLRAEDNVWGTEADSAKHRTTLCKTLNVDKSAPQLIQLSLLNHNNQPLDYVSPQQESARVVAEFTEASNITSASFDVSDLTELSQFKDEYRNKPASCSKTGTRWKCEISGIATHLSAPVTANIGVIAEDNFGNRLSISQAFTIAFDSTRPNIQELFSNAQTGSTNWVGPSGNTIYAIIQEDGAGMDSNLIFLDLQSIMGDQCCRGGACGFSCSQVQASSCLPTGSDEWTCQWQNVRSRQGVTSGTYAVNVIPLVSQDDAGNPASGLGSASFSIDADPPTITNITVLPGEPGRTVIASGDGIIVNAVITDNSGVDEGNSIADLSNLFDSGYTEEHPTCSQQSNNTWLCQWSAAPVRDGYYKLPITLAVKDIAGNEATATKDVEVLGVRTDAPNCFQFTYDSNNIYAIERSTIQNLNAWYYEAVPFTLNKQCTDASVSIIDPVITNCRSPAEDTNSNPVTIVPAAGGFSGFAQLAIDPSSVNPSWTSLGVDCELQYFVRTGTRLFSTAEVESINISIPVFSDLVEPGEKLSSEIDKIKKDTGKDWDKFVGGFETVLSYARGICGLKANVWEPLIALGTALGLVGGACIDTWVGRIFSFGACDAIEKTGNGLNNVGTGGEDTLGTIMNWGCGIAMCQQPEGMKDVPGKGSVKVIGGYCDSMREFINKHLSPEVLLSKVAATDPKASYYKALAGAVGSAPASNLELAKQSPVFALACFCLPGIIYNLEKYRQLKCWKGVCYRDIVRGGVPKAECDTQYQFNNCVYNAQWLTTIMDLLGWNRLFKIVDSIVNNPAAHVWWALKKGFAQGCKVTVAAAEAEGKTVAYTGWCVPLVVMNGLEAAAQLVQFGESVSKLKWDILKGGQQTDWCKRLNEARE